MVSPKGIDEVLVGIYILSMDRKYETLLVKKAKRGDAQAFEELEESIRVKVKGTLRSFVFNSCDIDEIYQISIIKSWKKIDKFKGDSSFYTWVTRIALNAAKDHLRKNRKKLVSLDEELSTESSTRKTGRPALSEFAFLDCYGRRSVQENVNRGFKNLQLSDCGAILADALDKIPNAHKEILKMSVFDDMSYIQISKRLKIPIGTVMSRLYYAKKYARSILKKNSDFEHETAK